MRFLVLSSAQQRIAPPRHCLPLFIHTQPHILSLTHTPTSLSSRLHSVRLYVRGQKGEAVSGSHAGGGLVLRFTSLALPSHCALLHAMLLPFLQILASLHFNDYDCKGARSDLERFVLHPGWERPRSDCRRLLSPCFDPTPTPFPPKFSFEKTRFVTGAGTTLTSLSVCYSFTANIFTKYRPM